MSAKPQLARLSRQRRFQLKWQRAGKCGICRDHPPIYKGGVCKGCYTRMGGGRLPKPQEFGCGITHKIHNLKQSIAKHRKWIARYRAELEEMKTLLAS